MFKCTTDNFLEKPLKMSDSDSELLTTNRVFSFQNESTIVSARGPNINTSNLTGISFRNNVLTSTMNMPRNYECKRAVSNYDQRSNGYRRETSPMSIVSACDAKQRNFNRLYNARGSSSQRSVYNGRSRSPMSVRSIDSNATMCASDIVMALNNTQFNKYDVRMLREAFNKLMKQKSRKRIEKRRNLKLFLKGYRWKSGYDSGELGSNSSMSSDDNRSTRTSNYKNNISSCRSTRTDVADFRKTIKETNMFNDCTDNFKQNRMHGIVGKPENINASISSVSSLRSMNDKPIPSKPMNQPVNFNKTQSQSSITLQDRFKNGFLLPSQRFNKSVAFSSIPEAAENGHYLQRNKHNPKTSNREHESHRELLSDDEEIFSEVTTIERPPVNQRKRSLEDDDVCVPVQKKPKVASPCKNMSKSFKNSTVIENAKKDFEFAKPAFPVRKSANLKPKVTNISIPVNMNATEQLISKSKAPLSDSIIEPLLPKPVNCISQSKAVEKEEDIAEQSTISQDTTDLSMRPSFIKRKLFTQNMDVTEKSNDVLAANSPQNSVYGAIQKEKNKARKLVTSQYCLSRDIQNEDNNLLALIHKIVPAERMNATNQTNKTVQNNKSEDNDDNWDVTSIISTRNNEEDVSDTFTDEETLLADGGKLQPSPKLARKLAKKSPMKQPLITEKKKEKTPTKVAQVNKKVLVDKNGTPKTTVQKYVKSFWDTDFESDVEGTPATRKQEFKENNKSENIAKNMAKPKNQGFSSMFPANKSSVPNNASIMNSTVDSVQRFNNTNRSLRLCSHRNSKPVAKKIVPEIIGDAKCAIEPQSKKQKPKESCLEKIAQSNKHENPKPEKSIPEIKKSTPKKRKANKETPEKAKKTEPLKKQNGTEKIQQSDDKGKPQNNRTKKTGTDQSKLEKQKESATVQNKPPNSKKSSTTQNKKEDQSNENKPQKKPVTNNKQQSKKIKDQKADITVNNKKNNQNSKTAKNKNVSKLSDSIVYEDSFNETNNNKSIRPVRSCRTSKLNETQDTSKANGTLSRTLRSRDVSLSKSYVNESKPAAKNSKKTKTTKNEQTTLSDLSFSISQDKPAKKPLSSLYNSRLFKTKDTDTSDVSFSLTNDKDSPLSKINQGNSAQSKITRFMKKALITLTPLAKGSLHIKDLSIAQRLHRNRLANRRYVS